MKLHPGLQMASWQFPKCVLYMRLAGSSGLGLLICGRAFTHGMQVNAPALLNLFLSLLPLTLHPEGTPLTINLTPMLLMQMAPRAMQPQFAWSPPVRLQPLLDQAGRPGPARAGPDARAHPRVARHLACPSASGGRAQARFAIGVVPKASGAGMALRRPIYALT